MKNESEGKIRKNEGTKEKENLKKQWTNEDKKKGKTMKERLWRKIRNNKRKKMKDV